MVEGPSGPNEGCRWKGNHWQSRNEFNVLPSVCDLPDDVKAIVDRNSLSKRETDHLVMNMEVGLQGRMAVELKHSVENALEVCPGHRYYPLRVANLAHAAAQLRRGGAAEVALGA